MAAELGLPQEERDRVYLAGLLHDIGRAAVPNRIWEKSGTLSNSERREAERHSSYTASILSEAEVFADVIDCAEGVHERQDASGYHRRARLDCKGASCLAVADIYNALLHARPWRGALSAEEAAKLVVGEVREGRLPADIVEALLRAGRRSAGYEVRWLGGFPYSRGPGALLVSFVDKDTEEDSQVIEIFSLSLCATTIVRILRAHEKDQEYDKHCKRFPEVPSICRQSLGRHRQSRQHLRLASRHRLISERGHIQDVYSGRWRKSRREHSLPR